MADYTRHLVQMEVSHIGNIERTPNIRNISPINGILAEADNGLRFVLGFYKQNNCVSNPRIENVIGVENFDSNRKERRRCEFVIDYYTGTLPRNVKIYAGFRSIKVLALTILQQEFPGRQLEDSRLEKAIPYSWKPQSSALAKEMTKYPQGEPFFCAKSPCSREYQKLSLAAQFDKGFLLYTSETSSDFCGFPIYDGKGSFVAIGLDSVETESGNVLAAIKLTDFFATYEPYLKNAFH